MSSETSSTVSTSSLLADRQSLSGSSAGGTGKSAATNVEQMSESTNRVRRKAVREQQRLLRMWGKLIDISLTDIAKCNNGIYEFFIDDIVMCTRGSYSQFDAREGRTRKLMPPQTSDCCQTFSTIAAVVLSSFGSAATMQECSTVSTVNYLLYISAWLHQLSSPAWPQRKARPTVGDLNACLQLREFFPSKISEGDFEVLFYGQQDRALELVRQLCYDPKRGRDCDGSSSVCGYVIASGDYTISIFSVAHDAGRLPSTGHGRSWGLYICDSHGTQPWSRGKACLTGVTVGDPKSGAGATSGVVAREEGLRYFAMILFALLEDHRRKTSFQHVPYMTWSPIRRGDVAVRTVEELKRTIDVSWIPMLLRNDVIKREAKKYGFVPMRCFLGGSATKPAAELMQPISLCNEKV